MAISAALPLEAAVVLGFNHEAHNASLYQISVKSDSTPRSYCDLNMSNLVAVGHLVFVRKRILTILRHPGPTLTLHQLSNFNTVRD